MQRKHMDATSNLETTATPSINVCIDKNSVDNSLASVNDWLDTQTSPNIKVTVDDDYNALKPHLGTLEIIAVEFQNTADGRGFTIGRTLRDWGFSGELRATGRFNQDQLHYLRRCGFNAFDLAKDIDPEAATRSLLDFSVRYQHVDDKDRPIYLRVVK